MMMTLSYKYSTPEITANRHVIIAAILVLIIGCLQLAGGFVSGRFPDDGGKQFNSRHGSTHADDVDQDRRPIASSGRLMTSLLSTGSATEKTRSNEIDDVGLVQHAVTLLGENDVIYDADDYQNDGEASVQKFDASPISAKQFRDRVLRPAASYRDVIRVFLKHGDWLSDDEIDDLITSSVTSYPADNFRDNDEWQHTLAAIGRTSGTTSGSKDVDDQESHLVEFNRAFQHALEMSTDFRTECQFPVPEVVHVNRLLRHPARLYLPECTVLHRCHSNRFCCPNNAECAVKSSNVVTLFFYEITVVSYSDQYEPYPAVRALNFVNHTECHCKPIAKQQTNHNCLHCPAPFVLDNEHTGSGNSGCSSCRCDSEHCLDVARGRTPLGHQEITCLHRSECQMPLCNFGLFDIDSGYCPCAAQDVTCICSQNEAHPQCEHGGSGDVEQQHELVTSLDESHYVDDYDWSIISHAHNDVTRD